MESESAKFLKFLTVEKAIDKQDGKSRINPRVLSMLGNHTIFATCICMYVCKITFSVITQRVFVWTVNSIFKNLYRKTDYVVFHLFIHSIKTLVFIMSRHSVVRFRG